MQIDAWARLRRITLEEWEVGALRMMDEKRLQMHRAKQDDAGEARDREKPIVSERPMTPELFDSIMRPLTPLAGRKHG